MSANPTARALAVRAHELLGDGQWHSYRKVMFELCQKVPDGRAYRVAMATFQAGRKNRGRDPDMPRVRYRSTDEIIDDGKREIVRAFLGNTAFENNRKSRQGGEPADAPERLIRMVGTLRALKAEPLRAALDESRYENEMMHDVLNKMVSYLRDIGHDSVADAFAIAIPRPSHGERRSDSDE